MRLKDNYDHYSGFEGEPELIVRYQRGGSVVSTLRAWGGYLDYIMDQVQPSINGWRGVALHYHLVTGWHDAPWEDPGPRHTVDVIGQADIGGCPEGVQEFAKHLLLLYREALSRGGEVVWSLE